METKKFKLNLKSKWVVGLVVSLSLGWGVSHIQSYVTSSNKRFKQRGLRPLDSQQVARRLGVR